MLTTSAFLLPSVPTMLIDEQRGDVTEMIEALQAAGERAAQQAPDAIVVLSSRWVSPDAFHADDSRRHRSVVDLPGFGVEPRFDSAGLPRLARGIVARATQLGVRAAAARRGMDSGAAIPLHFFARGRRVPVVPLSVGEAGREEHRAWGAAIRHALHEWEGRAQFVVGGALSWNLHAFNLRREIPECDALDERVVAALKSGRWADVESAADRLGDKAQPDAGLRHLDVLRGFLIGGATADVIERERLPGIGTVLAEFSLAAESGDAGD